MKTAEKVRMLWMCMILCFIAVSSPLIAQEQPVWLVLEEGELLLEQGKLSEALVTFRSVLNREPENGMAHYGIGKVYAADSNFSMALNSYQKALSYSYDEEELKVPVLYSLAKLHLLRDELALYEQNLLEILDMERRKGTDLLGPIVSRMRSVAETRGLDQLFLLYRGVLTFSLPARIALSGYYFNLNQFDSSINNALIAFVSPLTQGINRLFQIDPAYEFKDLLSLLQDLRSLPQIREYLLVSDFYKAAYLLGTSLFAKGLPSQAEYCWTLVTMEPDAGEWYLRGGRQLISPQIDSEMNRFN